MQYVIRNIEIIVVNNVKVKFFEVWKEHSGGGYVFFGRFSAPGETADKNLIKPCTYKR